MAITLEYFSKQVRNLLLQDDGVNGREKVRELLQKVLVDKTFTDLHVRDDYPQRTVLYEDADIGFAILSHVYHEARQTKPHDHGISWAIYGQVAGESLIRDWEIVEQATDDAPGKVRQKGARKLTPGVAITYNEGDIHSPSREGPAKLVRIEGKHVQQKKERFKWDVVESADEAEKNSQSKKDDQAKKNDQRAAVSSLWYTRCAVPTASSLAFQQGWLQESFAAIDISLDSVRGSEDDAVRASHYDNSLANQFREGGNVPAIWAKSIGQPTVVVGITWVEEYQVVVTRADSPLQSAADLRGRRLGLPRQQNSVLVDHGRASAQHGFVSTLTVAGISPDEVQFVDVEAPRTDIREDRATGLLSDDSEKRRTVLDALRDGDIDAAYIKGPGAIKNIRKHNLKVLFDISAHPDPQVHVNNAVPRPITADRELLAQRPDLIVRYLTVLLRTGEWAARHPQEALQLVAHETGSAVKDAATAYGPDLHNNLVPTLDADVVAGLERQKNFLFKWGYLPNDFDFADWIVYEPLREAQRLLAEEDASAVRAAS